ncbi:hypothetical protein RFI_04744 [Reticulomyxa filosa]|uniref:Uncharacterized protein n=1 Tax=Reticulomyxa filosa TaxID=46433 RepID=X6P2P2_RETFI|nr:hypothetical protein RFI_04744 [Reticulomyxa filosa]|eukprot:ETO32373.1 hypothetical protein RFI_04744 [Reticulomyxa filosa]
MLLVILVWCVSSYFELSKSGVFYHVGSCSSTWWMYTAMEFPALLAVMVVITWLSMRKFAEKKQLTWQPDSGDIDWNIRKVVLYPLAAMAAGILGGLLGIGGGMVVSPLLLELGVIPRVTSATSAIAVAVTSSSGTLQKYLLGTLRWDYMLYFMLVGVVGTFVGQTLLNYALKRYGRQSLVVFSVQAMLILAIVMMGVKGILEITQGNSDMRFRSPC